RAQLVGLRLLPARDLERRAEAHLGGREIALQAPQLALQPMELGLVEAVEEGLAARQYAVYERESLLCRPAPQVCLEQTGEMVGVRGADADGFVDREPLVDLRDAAIHVALLNGSPAAGAHRRSEPEVQFLLGCEPDAPLRQLEHPPGL